jgi:2-polyprenyl-6-methoxyphenol hydroxylase-like FAD-dependent oxidoreductase
MSKIVIFGLGPAGLVAAIKALRQNQQIKIFTDRKPGQFIRPQRIRLDDNHAHYLLTLAGLNGKEAKTLLYTSSQALDAPNHELNTILNKLSDKDKQFIVELVKAERVVEIKKLERFLYNRLLKTIAAKKLSVSNIIYGPGVSLTRVDTNTDQLFYQNAGSEKEEAITFSHIVAADGAHHSTANLLIKQNAIENLQYTKSENQGGYAYHGTVCLEINGGLATLQKRIREREMDTSLASKKYCADKFNDYKALDWQENYLPWSYHFADSAKRKIFFAGEIPKSIHTMQNQEEKAQALVKWFSTKLKHEYNLKDEDIFYKAYTNKHTEEKMLNKYRRLVPKNARHSEAHQQALQAVMIKKQALRATSFEMDLHKTESPSLLVGQKGRLILLGDAYFSPHYQTQRGANNAIASARAYGDAYLIEKDKSINFNNETFTTRMQALASDYNRLLNQHQAAFKQQNTVAKQYKTILVDNVTKLCSHIADMDANSEKRKKIMGMNPDSENLLKKLITEEDKLEKSLKKDLEPGLEKEDNLDIISLYQTMIKLKPHAAAHRHYVALQVALRVLIVAACVCTLGVGFIGVGIAGEVQRRRTGLTLAETFFSLKTKTELMIEHNLGIMDHLVEPVTAKMK